MNILCFFGRVMGIVARTTTTRSVVIQNDVQGVFWQNPLRTDSRQSLTLDCRSPSALCEECVCVRVLELNPI